MEEHDMTQPVLYLEKLRREKAHEEIRAGTIELNENEELQPCSCGCRGYIHVLKLPKEVRDRMVVPIIHKREKPAE
jgi:hypothetical protein